VITGLLDEKHRGFRNFVWISEPAVPALPGYPSSRRLVRGLGYLS
jgi:hypothetical protein